MVKVHFNGFCCANEKIFVTFQWIFQTRTQSHLSPVCLAFQGTVTGNFIHSELVLWLPLHLCVPHIFLFKRHITDVAYCKAMQHVIFLKRDRFLWTYILNSTVTGNPQSYVANTSVYPLHLYHHQNTMLNFYQTMCSIKIN